MDFAAAAERTLETLRETVGIQSDDEILEIGCGVARMAHVLAPICQRWTGVDVSENMLRHARERTKDLPNVAFECINGWDLGPIADASLDVVYCTVVFMHLDEWDRFNYVCEAKRVLRPGGRLYVDNFNLLSNAGWDFFVQHLVEVHPLERPPNISKSSTPDELRCYLERAGFDDVQVGTSYDRWVFAWGVKPVA